MKDNRRLGVVTAGFLCLIAASPTEVAGFGLAPVEWVSMPIHVGGTIKDFEMSKTLVTVEQYAECVSNGSCAKPGTSVTCNWGKAGRKRHPVNCVNWKDANDFAKFESARLPREFEWEYAATSGGKKQKYPWGNEDATCERAVMSGNGGRGCGSGSTMPVCSKPAGNTAQGLCDMAGNVTQWTQDKYLNADGRAVIGISMSEATGLRVMRGGSWRDGADTFPYIYGHNYGFPGVRADYYGFRLARSR